MDKLFKTIVALLIAFATIFIFKLIYEVLIIIPLFPAKVLARALYFYWSYTVATKLYLGFMNDDFISFIIGVILILTSSVIIIINILIDGWLFKLFGVYCIYYMFVVLKARYDMIGEK